MRAWQLCLLLAALKVAAVGAAEDRYIEDTDRFPGWKGELPGSAGNNPGQPKALSQDRTGVTVGFGEDGVVIYLPLQQDSPQHEEISPSRLLFAAVPPKDSHVLHSLRNDLIINIPTGIMERGGHYSVVEAKGVSLQEFPK